MKELSTSLLILLGNTGVLDFKRGLRVRKHFLLIIVLMEVASKPSNLALLRSNHSSQKMSSDNIKQTGKRDKLIRTLKRMPSVNSLTSSINGIQKSMIKDRKEEMHAKCFSPETD